MTKLVTTQIGVCGKTVTRFIAVEKKLPSNPSQILFLFFRVSQILFLELSSVQKRRPLLKVKDKEWVDTVVERTLAWLA